MHHPTDRITHTTAFVTPVVEHWLEREIAQLVHPMKDRSNDPAHHEQTLLPRSYISLPSMEPERDADLWLERSLVVQRVVGPIPRGGPIELFLVPTSVPRLV